MQLITCKDGGGLFWGLDHRPWAKEAGAAWRFGQQEGAGPTQWPSVSLGLLSSTWQLGPALPLRPPLPWRVSWLGSHPTGVVCAEFSPKEGESPKDSIHHCLHVPRRQDSAAEITHSFVVGPNEEPEALGCG